jgi:transcriptional regulator with XRE-family HTH domain
LLGSELRAWRRQHAIPPNALACALGYASASTLIMQELGKRPIPAFVVDYVRTYQPPPKISGPQLRAWRQAQGFTVRAFGACFDCTETAVRMWELGYRRVPWRVRCYLAHTPATLPPSIVRRRNSRADIYQAVTQGAHTVAALQAVLSPPLGENMIRHHLRYLNDAGLLCAQRDGPHPTQWYVLGAAPAWQPAEHPACPGPGWVRVGEGYSPPPIYCTPERDALSLRYCYACSWRGQCAEIVAARPAGAAGVGA